MLGKKRNKQHRIGDEALDLFRSILPKTKAFDIVFTEESRDYGIDGHLQIFINDEHTGNVPRVQIKGNETGEYIDKGKTLRFSLDLDSAFFLIEQAQDPTALIVVDNDKGSVLACHTDQLGGKRGTREAARRIQSKETFHYCSHRYPEKSSYPR